jgi:anti-anti-sigma factor
VLGARRLPSTKDHRPEGRAAELSETAIPRQPGVRVTGHADVSTKLNFEQFLVTLCRQSDGDMHLDLAELDFIDVSGVITLVRAADSLGDGRKLILHNPPESLRRILDLLMPTSIKHSVLLD